MPPTTFQPRDASRREDDLLEYALRSVGDGAAPSIERARALSMEVTAGSTRSQFEHDRDRIMHCRQLRRLSGKTQMFIAPSDGDLRTRLTHSIEVYQIATSIGRRLGLNVPAVEAMALGHDVGHTPFGHAGEAELDELLERLGGFHHAAHSVWTLDSGAYDDSITDDETSCGLNLTHAVREGILHHGWFERKAYTPYHILKQRRWSLGPPCSPAQPSLEAQVVRLADQLAYLNHDIEDLVAFGFDKILSHESVRRFFDTDPPPEPKVKQIFLRLVVCRRNSRVKELVKDATEASTAAINDALQGRRDRTKEPLVVHSELFNKVRECFYKFFDACVYNDVRVKHKNKRGRECIRFLFEYFCEFFKGNDHLLPRHIKDMLQEKGGPWWHTYHTQLDANDDFKARYGTRPLEALPSDEDIAARLAARDVVAFLTDTEALSLFRALQEPESQRGIAGIDYLVEAFPSDERMRASAQSQHQRADAIKALLSTAAGIAT